MIKLTTITTKCVWRSEPSERPPEQLLLINTQVTTDAAVAATAAIATTVDSSTKGRRIYIFCIRHVKH